VRTDGHPLPLDPTDPEMEADITPWLYECNDGTSFHRNICTGADCPVDTVDPIDPSVASVRERVVAMVDPPLPQLRHTFDDGDFAGDIRAVVNAETWWWSDGTGDPITVGDTDGGTWVSLTATPGDLVVDPGDGSGLLACDYPGVAFNQSRDYDDQMPGADGGACVHVYRGRADSVTATASVTWSLEWSGFSVAEGFLSGTLPDMVRSETVTFPVRELQSVITGP